MRGESDTFRFPLRESKASNGEPLYRVDRIFRSVTIGRCDQEVCTVGGCVCSRGGGAGGGSGLCLFPSREGLLGYWAPPASSL